MTMAAKSQPVQRDGVTSLIASSRESGSLRTHTRERVSEAIALVRARQEAEAQRKTTDVIDVTVIDVTAYDDARSPLVPAGQTGSSSEIKKKHRHSKPKSSAPQQHNSFLMNVFASRSDVDTTPDIHEDDSLPMATMSDEQNIPEHAAAARSSRFVNPLEFVKREMQFATRSASSGRPTTATATTNRSNDLSTDVASVDSSEMMPLDEQMKSDIGNFVDRLLNIESASSSGDESSDSFDIPVDSKTIEEVNTFLYSLNIKEPEQQQQQQQQQLQSVIESVTGGSESDDPFEAMRRAASDDFIIDGSQDHHDQTDDISDGADDISDGSSHGSSINPETLEEIGAYIDAISTDPTGSSSGDAIVADVLAKKQYEDAPSFADPVLSVNSWQSETIASKSVTATSTEHATISSYMTDDAGQTEIVQNQSNDSSNDTIIEQTRVSKPSPIYELVEAKSLPRGTEHKDPPAAITSRNPDQVDPPEAATSTTTSITANMNEAVMRMHESQTVAPSYSVESLESEGAIMDHHHKATSMEDEEKKGDDEMDQETTITQLEHRDEVGKNLYPVIEASSAESDNFDELLDEALNSNEAQDSIQIQVGGDHRQKTDTAVEMGLPPTPRDQTEKSSGETAHEILSTIQSEYSEASSTSTCLPPTPHDQTHENFGETTPHAVVSIVQSETSEADASSSCELVDDAGVPIRAQLSAGGSEVDGGRASELTGRYDMIEAGESEENDSRQEDGDDESQSSDIVTDLPDIGLRNLPNSPSMKDDNSLPWDLKDIASEETMKAAGRTRPAALMPASRSKARKLKSILSDDSSIPQSEFGMSETGDSRDGGTEAEADAPNAGFAINGFVIDDSEAGVEVCETTENASSRVKADGGQEEEIEERKPMFVDTIASVPSAPSEDRANSLIDPSGRLGPTVDTEMKVIDKRPDPDTTYPGKNELCVEDGFNDEVRFSDEVEYQVNDELQVNDDDQDRFKGEVEHRFDHQVDVVDEFDDQFKGQVEDQVENNVEIEFGCNKYDVECDVEGDAEYDAEGESEKEFVQTFLEQGSISADKAADLGTETNETKTDSKPTLQSYWYNPFASPSKEKTDVEHWYNPFLSPAKETTADDGGIGFLEQFQSLEIDNEEEDEHSDGGEPEVEGGDSSEAAVKTPRNLFTLIGIVSFFAGLDAKFAETENRSMAQNVRFFQRLVAPVVAGEKPSIIQAAQIRQAAIRAEVPLEVVDRFLDLTDELTQSGQQVVSNTPYERMEELTEDDTIISFLTRFGAQHGRGHSSPNANAWMMVTDECVRTDGEDERLEFDNEVTLKLELQIQESDEDEWWKDQEQTNYDRKLVNSISDESAPAKNISDDERQEDEGIESMENLLLAPTDPSQSAYAQSLRVHKEAPLLVNKWYAGSYNVREDDEWSRRNAMGQYGAGWEAHANWLSPRANFNLRQPGQINGVEATENLRRFVFSKKIFKNHQPWRKLYRERTKFHPGFIEVDVNSIYESTAVDLTLHDQEDCIPWERREVQQRFLHEKSYSFARNWFGDLVRRRGNQKVKAPVCKPKSMEMPIENLPEQGEWTKEWFTQWKAPIQRRSTSKSDDDTTDGSSTDHGSVTDRGIYTDRGTTDHGSCTDGSIAHQNYESSFSGSDRTPSSGASGSASWEEAPECGEIINVRQKIGERVTRVHPDFTSSLHRSRWRKKYFPRGTFPY